MKEKTLFYCEAADLAFNDKVLKLTLENERLNMQIEDIESVKLQEEG